MIFFLLFGIIQGLTEFLPVSSSGHLFLLYRIVEINENPLAFFVWLHLATLGAVIAFFHKELPAVIKNKSLILKIFLATFIAAGLGVTIDTFFSDYFENQYLVSGCFFITAALLFSSKNKGGDRTLFMLSVSDALLLGLAQAIAVFPGISRSGITIVTLLALGYKPQHAFSLSFIAGIPLIFGAFLWKSPELLQNTTLPLASLTAGFLSAAASGLIALFLLKRLIQNHSLHRFWIYCSIVAGASLFI